MLGAARKRLLARMKLSHEYDLKRSSDPTSFAKLVTSNTSSLLGACSYVQHSAYLAKASALNLQLSSMDDVDLGSDYINSLASFCELHRSQESLRLDRPCSVRVFDSEANELKTLLRDLR